MLKTTIMSMPISHKRRKFMEYKLKNVPILDYSYFDALNGDLLEEYTEYKNYCLKHNRQLLHGEAGAYGCLMSYKKLFGEQYESQLILEDDVYFHHNATKMIDILYNNCVFDNYDIIYFGYNNYKLSEKQKIAIEANNTMLPVSKKHTTCGTYAVWYSLKAIDYINILLDNLTHDTILPIDHLVWKTATRLNSIICNPPICISEVRDSSIRGARNIESFYRTRLTNLEEYSKVNEYHRWMQN